MARILRLVACFAVLLAPPAARAACTSGACPDQAAVDAVRDRVAALCDCAGSDSHKAYLRCAKGVVRAAGELPKACRKAVLRCETASTCGRDGVTVCCAATARGRVKARIMRLSHTCGGTVCSRNTHVVDACTGEARCAPARNAVRSFRSVQAVFTTSCALPTCHSAFTRQGELVLDNEDTSYGALVGQPAEHPQAKAQGLLRVAPGDPSASFLVRKLRGLGPGDSMPQGAPLLPEPAIKMVEDWIARGARPTAEECPSAGGAARGRATGTGTVAPVCDDTPVDTGPYQWEPLPPLEVPAPGTGIQLHLPPRDVDSGSEWEMCYAVRVDWAAEAAKVGLTPPALPAISKQVYRMQPGSHHLLLYAYFGAHPEVFPTDSYFPCRAANCVNDADCPEDAGRFTIPIGGTQVAGTRYEVDYPEGVGVPILSPTSVLIINPHYTNPFQPPQPIYGEAWLNLYFYPPGGLKAILDGIFAVNYADLLVEPYQTRTISRIWSPVNILTRGPVDAAIFQLFGHMHLRGTEFRIDFVKGGSCSASGRLCGRDDDCACPPYLAADGKCQAGETCQRGAGAEDSQIYYTTHWDQAPILDFQAPYLLVSRDQGLRWTCTHTNGVQGDPTRPPKRCAEGCRACGWDDATRTCVFTRGVELGYESTPRVFAEGDPMPLVFGLLADDDMCNMFGYFIDQSSLPLLH